jgi:hypothetical protein
MANYMVPLTRNLSTTQSVGVIYTTSAVALRRIAIYDFTIGVQGTPAGLANLWQLQRFTAAGTSTAVTPTPVDPGDPASLTSAGQNNSVEPSYTAGTILASKALNQQATYRWFAGQPDQRLIAPATNNNGIGVATPTAGSVGVAGTIEIYYNE